MAREFIRIAREKFRVEPRSLSFALEAMRRLPAAPASGASLQGVPDPDDMPILACALAANADLFVTGDKALLDVGKIGTLDIFLPRQCWERLFPFR